jgi:hypothetical protein
VSASPSSDFIWTVQTGEERLATVGVVFDQKQCVAIKSAVSINVVVFIGGQRMNAFTRCTLPVLVAGLLPWSLCGCQAQKSQLGKASQHRVNAAQCEELPAAGDCSCTTASGCPTDACTSDTACVDAGPNGRCISMPAVGCGCTFDACINDSDCPIDQTCACHGSAYAYGGIGNLCVPGNCRVDADCGAAGFCSPSAESQCGSGADYFCLGYYCHTPKDTCTNDSDCGSGAVCAYSYGSGFWQCEPYEPPG